MTCFTEGTRLIPGPFLYGRIFLTSDPTLNNPMLYRCSS